MCDTEPNRIADKEENGGKDEHFFISPGDTHEGKDTLAKGKLVDITKDKPVKVTIKVGVPVRDHPKGAQFFLPNDKIQDEKFYGCRLPRDVPMNE
ncbi:hypothetical protein RUM44_005430 [Polyplax serrata]|uniref:Uncharacterized protein n=1 Tax=Polyplax serrata TaxID=468196 RepID=A0ABR1AW49_POLSC